MRTAGWQSLLDRRKGLVYVPGLLYDLAFGGILSGVRRLVARAVAGEKLFPCLDVCCGTGSQVRAFGDGRRREVIGLDGNAGTIRYAAARASSLLFVQGDAMRLPFKSNVFRAIMVSFGLHDKFPEERVEMMAEARRVLVPGGKFVFVDFENPWNTKSRLGAFFVRLIERLAGGDHCRNGREFLQRGGLRAFLRENGFKETVRCDIETGSVSVVVARVDN